MNRWIFFVWLLFTFSIRSSGQGSVQGKVINEKGEPMAGVSVFISNTSRGTITNGSGSFSLDKLPEGQHELVASFIGYETFVRSFLSAELPLQLQIRLKPKPLELTGVTVAPFEKDGWAKWGKLFTDNFIGNSDNATTCTIKNYKSIRFRFLKKDNILTALAMEPLIIINRALGYRIQFQLEKFEVNYNTHSTLYLGYPLFEEIKEGRKRWKRARARCYGGSIMQFMRSVYAGQLLQNGFEVKRLKKIPNVEKERIAQVFKPVKKTILDGHTGQPITVVDYDYERFPRDTVNYYQFVLRQKDYFDVYGDSLLSADSVCRDSVGVKWMDFPDYLFVTYKNQNEERRYLEFIGEAGRRSFYQRSSISLNDRIIIQANGNYFNPQDLFSNGYWGWSEKMANLLPYDYQPREP